MIDMTEFTEFYGHLTLSKLKDLENFYTSDIQFLDPIHRLSGLQQLRNYFNGMLVNIQNCVTTFDQILEIPEDNAATVIWTMQIAHPTLNWGQPYTVEGCSILKFRGNKIYYHRDYYDAGELLYERIPLVKTIVAKIKSRVVK